MEDWLNGGQSFYCRECNETGDMIELAAKAWGMSVAATIIKLTRLGFDLPADSNAIRGYLTGHVEYRKRLRQLWKDCQTFPCHNRNLLRPMMTAAGATR